MNIQEITQAKEKIREIQKDAESKLIFKNIQNG